jgi:hypothetical protein
MPYIKISDPNTIDLASWQQVINVVNQHSDSINTITNNFGAQNPVQPNWDGTEDFAYAYDPGSQKIIYGRTLIDPLGGDATVTISGNGYVHYITVLFSPSGGTFSAKPIVTVTGRHSSTDPTLPHNLDIIATVQDVKATEFTLRIVNARSRKTDVNTIDDLPLDPYNFYVNWIAFGPK